MNIIRVNRQNGQCEVAEGKFVQDFIECVAKANQIPMQDARKKLDEGEILEDREYFYRKALKWVQSDKTVS